MTNQLFRGSAEQQREFPLFNGLVHVLDLIKELYQRRRRPQRREFTEGSRMRRGPKWLPMLCLVRPERQSALLPALSSWLNEADPHRVPHAYVELTPDRREPTREPRDTKPPRGPWTTRDVEAIRDNLRSIANALADSRNGRTRHLRFPRFGLAYWLMQQDLPGYEPSERRVQLRKELQERSPDPRRIVDDVVPEANAPWGWWYARTAFNICLPWLFALEVSGRVRWPGRVAYHFLHQNYLAPDDPGTFLGFAERLTNGEWQKESPEQLAKLLVGAFLEDLRAEYRGPFWSAGRRRTSYALVLLDNITRHNGGYTLQKTINNVRNDTGVHDPLLLITASAKVPPHAAEPGADGLGEVVFDATETDVGYDAWRNDLTVKRRDRQEMAFYLPISTFNEPDEEQLASARRTFRGRRPVLASPPWWSRRALWIVLAGAVLLALSGVYASYSYSQCGHGWYPPSLNPTLSWSSKSDECIGVTDGSYDFSDNRASRPEWVTGQIEQLNSQADDKHAEDPERPVVTTTYVGEFGDNDQDLASQYETLAGLARAQRENNDHRSGTLLRVLIANAGKNMAHGQEVARQIVQLPEQNPSVVGDDSSLVGAVGLDRSSARTTSTVGVLNQAGLPVVAAPLSSDELADRGKFPLYRSIALTNRHEAQVAAAFARQLGEAPPSGGPPAITPKTIHVYSDSGKEGDTYGGELAQDLEQSVPPDFGVFRHPVGDREEAGRTACGLDGMVYFAGRGTDFEPFLDGVSSECQKQSVVAPPILASDDVSRFVADQDNEHRVQVPFHFASFAVAAHGDPDQDNRLLYEEKRVYSDLFHHPEWRDSRGKPALDGHAFLVDSAVNSLLEAVRANDKQCQESVRDSQYCSGPSSATVLQHFIRHGSTLKKPISVVEVGSDGPPTVVGTCGGPPTDQRPPLRYCPPPER